MENKKIKDAWEIREWVEDALPEKRSYINWAEAHSDEWGKDCELLHERDSTKFIEIFDVLDVIDKHFTEQYMGTEWCHLWKKVILKELELLDTYNTDYTK